MLALWPYSLLQDSQLFDLMCSQSSLVADQMVFSQPAQRESIMIQPLKVNSSKEKQGCFM